MNADDHGSRPSGVDERSQSIEDGRESKLLANGSDADHGGVVIRGVEEEEGGLSGDGGDVGGGEGGYGAAEGEEDVGGSGGGGGGFVAVLLRRTAPRKNVRKGEERISACRGKGWWQRVESSRGRSAHLVNPATSSSSDDTSRRRDVEGVLTISACADNIAHGPIAMSSYIHSKSVPLHNIRTRRYHARLSILSSQAKGGEESTDLRS